MDFITTLTEVTGNIAGMAWGIPSIVLLVGTGLYLTIRLRMVQVRGFKHAINLIRGKYDKPDDPGEVTHFQALSTALSATIGTGNIAGVATAIAFGGPGAVFWMWVTALVGMASKYTSCTLALKYRITHPDGSVSGGPMYTLSLGFSEKLGMKRTGAVLGFLFALFTLIASFGIGNMVQANSVMDGLTFIYPDAGKYKLFIGVILAIGVGLVIIGDPCPQRISNPGSLLYHL